MQQAHTCRERWRKSTSAVPRGPPVWLPKQPPLRSIVHGGLQPTRYDCLEALKACCCPSALHKEGPEAGQPCPAIARINKQRMGSCYSEAGMGAASHRAPPHTLRAPPDRQVVEHTLRSRKCRPSCIVLRRCSAGARGEQQRKTELWHKVAQSEGVEPID